MDLSVDLAGGADFVVGTRHNLGGLGTGVVGLGDVNGDGLDDVAVAAPHDSRPGRDQAGAVYVVFGSRSLGRVDPASRSFRGFRILGPAGSSMAGASVAAAGDFNGDGLKDVIVGVPGAPGDGAAYVVFGKRDRADVDLRAPGARAVSLVAPGRLAVGSLVAGAGDMNHDGRGDVAVSAIEQRDRSGSVFVVFGGADRGPRDISRPGQGFQVTGFNTGDPEFGSAPTPAVAGDVNGDGTGDLVVDGFTANELGGVAYVVFGKRSSSSVDVRHLGHRGFLILDAAVGGPVARVGDLNRSGRGAVVVNGPGRATSVVFGSRSTGTVDLNRLGRRGFRINGAGPGPSVAGTGDVNGDRRPDVLIGQRLASPRRRPGAGAAYVLFGKSGTAPIDVHHLVT